MATSRIRASLMLVLVAIPFAITAPSWRPAIADEPPPEALPDLGGGGNAIPTTDEMDALIEREASDPEGRLNYTKACVMGALAKGPPGCASFGYDMALATAASLDSAMYFNLESFRGAETIFGRDPANAEKYFEKCRAVSILLGTRAEQSPEVRQAAAYGRLAHAWARMLAGKALDGSRVRAAAETIQSLAADLPPPADAWSRFVRAAMRSGTVAANAPVADWAKAEAQRLAKENPDDPVWKRASTAELLAAAVNLADMEDKGAAAALTSVLTAPDTEAAVAAGDRPVVALYNRAVTAARRLKLPLKTAYRTTEHRTSGGVLTFELPSASGWTEQAVNGDQAVAWWVRKHSEVEKDELRVWKYSTSIDYVDEDGKVVGGDNIGARLRKFFVDDKASLSRIKRATAGLGRFSKNIPDVKGYEVKGEDNVGLEFWFKEWYFKPDSAKKYVYNVSLRREGVILYSDPHLDFILESMRETEKATK